MLRYLFLSLLLISSIVASAQMFHGGVPSAIQGASNTIELRAEPALMALKDEPSNDKGPLRYAYPIFVNYSPSNSGEWYEMEDGSMVWQLCLKSKGAESLSVKFTKFRLVDGTRVFVYNKDRSYILGGFTKDNNKSFGSLSTAAVPGEEIIIELQISGKSAKPYELEVGEIYHDFLGVLAYLKSDRFGYASDCNVDVSCDASIPEEIRRSVCKITINGLLCSGTLLNNTSYDGKPYFLTAGHCVGSQDDAKDVVAYFNYEAPACIDNIAGAVQQHISGADYKAGVKNMDFALVRLTQMPPASYRAYWAGWDKAVAVNDAVYCIHHPQGDVKKVSWSGGAPISTTFNEFGFINDAHWRIKDWVSGTTEGGSSGSGLFTQGDKLIGNLSGGYASCDYPHDDYYARFNKAWDFHEDASMQLSVWLDSIQTGESSIPGFDYYNGLVKRISFANDEMSPVLLYSNDFKGAWSGTNQRGYDAFAQHINDYHSATIHGIYVIPAITICDELKCDSIRVKVWNSIEGRPANAVYTSNYIQLKTLKQREYLVDISSNPIDINGAFFIGIELDNPSGPDTIALYNSKKNIGSLSSNRAFIRDNGTWKGFNEVHPSHENGAFWIDFLGSNLEVATDIDTLEQREVIISPNPCREGYINYVTNLEHLSKVEMYSVNGSLVTTYARKGQTKDQLDIPDSVTAGVYILVFKNAVQSITRKILILP